MGSWFRWTPLATSVLFAGTLAAQATEPQIRLGLIGLDTSHAVAFTKLLNDPAAIGDLARVKVVAGLPWGTDVPYSMDRISGYTEDLRARGVTIVDTLDALLERVDGVLVESVDGRIHLPQVRAVFEKGLPTFIDKPLSADLRDAVAIAELAEQHGVSWFTSSSLRFGATVPDSVGAVLGCEAHSPCSLEPTHSDLYWYGIHGVESLFTVLGPGCDSVSCVATDGAHVATGVWSDGRIGTFRGIRGGKTGYGATVFGSKGIAQRTPYPGYGPLVTEIARFFVTGEPPVRPAESLEICAFMTAAEASARRGGESVTLASVLAKAREPRPETRPNILFCIADDWSWPHASAYGDPVVSTPSFDRIAREGVLFTHAYCSSPSCTPSRGGIVSGQAIHRLREGASLHSSLPADIPVYPDLLEAAGYAIGHRGKAWGPGRPQAGGRDRNPAGPRFKSFEEFLGGLSDDQPFCFWWGSSDPHRPYQKGSGIDAGMDPAAVRLPPFLPDTPEVRSDVLDYYVEVQRFDRQVGEALALLEARGCLDNTIVVITSDNGMPFPRGKATVYDGGTRMPMALMWKDRLRGGRTSRAFVSHTDLAPTFLEAAGREVPVVMTGRSLWPLLTSGTVVGRDRVFLERERHAHVREGNLGYPVRAVRTHQFLYVQNLRPERWPTGDPQHVFSVGPFGDCDASPTKQLIEARRDDPAIAPFFQRAFGMRPAEELDHLEKDPGQLVNVAADPVHAAAKARLAASLREWMAATADPRIEAEAEPFDAYPYYGGRSGGRKR